MQCPFIRRKQFTPRSPPPTRVTAPINLTQIANVVATYLQIQDGKRTRVAAVLSAPKHCRSATLFRYPPRASRFEPHSGSRFRLGKTADA